MSATSIRKPWPSSGPNSDFFRPCSLCIPHNLSQGPAYGTVVTRGCNPGGSQKASAIPKAFGHNLTKNVVEHRRHLVRRGPAQRLHAHVPQTVPAQAADFLVPIFLPNLEATAQTTDVDGADCAVWNGVSLAHVTITAAFTLRQRSHFRMDCGRLVGGRTSDLNQPLLLVLTGTP